MRAVEPPPSLRGRHRRWSWSPAWTYEGVVTTWRLCSAAGELGFLKVRAPEESPSLQDEAARLTWAREHLPVPAVLGSGTDDGVDWLLLEGLAGRDATSPEPLADPGWTVPVLARALRRFHEAPVGGLSVPAHDRRRPRHRASPGRRRHGHPRRAGHQRRHDRGRIRSQHRAGGASAGGGGVADQVRRHFDALIAGGVLEPAT